MLGGVSYISSCVSVAMCGCYLRCWRVLVGCSVLQWVAVRSLTMVDIGCGGWM